MTNKVLATQIIFFVVAIVGFLLAKIGAEYAMNGQYGMFLAGLILLIASIIVQIAIVMKPLMKVIVEKFKGPKENQEDNEGLDLGK